MKKIYLYLFSLLSLSFLFLFYPFGYIKSYNEEEIAKEVYKIELKERDVNSIISTLNQKITNNSIDLFTSQIEPEKEAVFSLIRSSVRINSFNYIINQAPKEIAADIINKGVKIAPLFFDFSFSTFWKLSLNEAKKYAVDWLLKNELRIGGGNLPLSYKTYKGDVENVNFPFVLVYNPGNNHIEIIIYSPSNVYPPESKGGFSNYSIKNSFWNIDGWLEKGSDFLSPFIINISGKIEKRDNGHYFWLENPIFEISFPDFVPEFEFENRSFLEKRLDSLKEKIIAFERAEEKIKEISREIANSARNTSDSLIESTKGIGNRIINSIKGFFSNISSIFSSFNPFQASMTNLYLYSDIPDPNFLLRQKSEEILNIIKNLDIPIEEDLLSEYFTTEEGNLDDFLIRLNEIDRIIKEIKERMILTVEEKEEEIKLLEEEICNVNINTASKEDLQKLTGIGPTYADRIINERPFSSLNDLLRVNGIGEVTLSKIIEQNCAFVERTYYTSNNLGNNNSSNNNIEEEICNVNINTASKEDLQKLTGIGPTYADRIINERPFSSLNDLLRVNGIGEVTLSKIIEQNCAFVEINEEEEDTEEEDEDTGEIIEQNYYWANIQQNPQKTGQTSVIGPAELENPISEIFIEGNENNDYFYNLAIDLENNLYFKAKINNKEGIYAFNQNKEEKWFKSGEINSISNPIITSNGDVFFYTNGGYNLYLYSSDGDIIWEKSLTDYGLLFDPVSYNNLIYSFTNIKNGFRNLIAIDESNGNIIWEYEIKNGIGNPSSLSVSKDEFLYFGVENFLYSINPNGEESWVKEFIGNYNYNTSIKPTVNTPISINREEIYSMVFNMEDWGSMQDRGYNHCLFKINTENAEEIWSHCAYNFRFETLSISESGNIYFGVGYYNGIRWFTGIYNINNIKGGTSKWIINELDSQVEILLIDKNENIYGIFGNGLLKAYDKEGELKWQYSISPSYRIKYLSMDGNGNLYIPGPKNIHIIKKEELITPVDSLAPIINFDLEETQNNLSFSILWEGEDVADEEVNSSGIEGYQLKYSLDNEDFTYLIPSEGEDFINQTEYNFEGEENETYYFKLRAKDNAGNISDWVTASTTIILSEEDIAEDLLIVEVQIEGEDIDNDFIKIYNPNNFDIDITDYKLRKRNSSGTESSIRVFPTDSLILQKDYFTWANSKDSFSEILGANSSSTATISKNNSIALIDKEDNVISSLGWGESINPFVEGIAFGVNPAKNEALRRLWYEELEEYSNTKNNSLDFQLSP